MQVLNPRFWWSLQQVKQVVWRIIRFITKKGAVAEVRGHKPFVCEQKVPLKCLW